MELNTTIERLGDAERVCKTCGDVTVQRQYDNGRQRLYVCSGCSLVTASYDLSDRSDDAQG